VFPLFPSHEASAARGEWFAAWFYRLRGFRVIARNSERGAAKSI